jgi:hypothetical protein
MPGNETIFVCMLCAVITAQTLSCSSEGAIESKDDDRSLQTIATEARTATANDPGADTKALEQLIGPVARETSQPAKLPPGCPLAALPVWQCQTGAASQ